MEIVQSDSESMAIINCNDEAKSYIKKKYRYIRHTLWSNNKNSSTHFVELKAFVNGVNVALNKSVSIVSGSSAREDYKNLWIFVDNDITADNYLWFRGRAWLQIDLWAGYELETITFWNYWSDGRYYNQNVVQVSEDGTNRVTVFDSSINGTYTETSAWKTITVQ